jgi:hypothetical protein
MKDHRKKQPLSRREALCRMGSGFGMLSFAALANSVSQSVARAGAVTADRISSRG